MPRSRQPLLHAKTVLLYSPGNLAVDYAAGLLRGIERGLMEIGAEVRTFNYALYKPWLAHQETTRGPDEPWPVDAPPILGMNDFLESSWPGEGIDLCFGLFHDVFLSPQLMATLRRRCGRIVNYPLNLLDQPHRFEKALQFCDDTFSAEEEALAALRSRTTKRVVYVPMAADPFIFRPVGTPQSPRLLFVGSIYADRPWFLDRCATAIPTSVYGSNYRAKDVARSIVREAIRHRHFTPPRQALRMLLRSAFRDRRLVSDEEFVRLVGDHGVTIGLSSVRQERTGRICQKVRLRDYEATMCGACHIASRLPELERGFEEGKEIVFYDSAEELHELLSRIRRGEVLWREIGRAARLRAERSHSWTARLREAFS